MAEAHQTRDPRLRALHVAHERHWRDAHYVYPVISRRSGGLSIGVNLNPDKACNFDCIYCQVDRTTPPRVRTVDLARLAEELETLLRHALDGSLFASPRFAATPPEMRRVRDIAFSGDGEPTASPVFAEAVELAARLRRDLSLHDTKLVLITDACYLTRPAVARGLAVMDANNGEIWAKLDAGTEDYYRLINRPNVPLATLLDNILAAARARPLVIQSLWMNVAGQPPSDAEIGAFVTRLRDILAAGGKIKLVQVYTVARPPADPSVTALSPAQLTAIANRVRAEAPLPAEIYGGIDGEADASDR